MPPSHPGGCGPAQRWGREEAGWTKEALACAVPLLLCPSLSSRVSQVLGPVQLWAAGRGGFTASSYTVYCCLGECSRRISQVSRIPFMPGASSTSQEGKRSPAVSGMCLRSLSEELAAFGPLDQGREKL